MKKIKFLRELFKKKPGNKNNTTKKILSGNICGEKIYTSSSATLSIKNNSDKEKKVEREKIEKILDIIIDNAKNDPKKLFDYIKKSGTKVYTIKNADKILSALNEQEGFILPKTGLCALYLNLILNKKISTKTQEMFVIKEFNINLYTFVYQFYNWYCYKTNSNPLSEKTNKNFKNIFKICSSQKQIDTLTFEEILDLKSAIKKDVEAIDFALNFVKNKSLAKQTHDKMKQGQTVQV